MSTFAEIALEHETRIYGGVDVNGESGGYGMIVFLCAVFVILYLARNKKQDFVDKLSAYRSIYKISKRYR